jgi:hypothetical protein
VAVAMKRSNSSGADAARSTGEENDHAPELTGDCARFVRERDVRVDTGEAAETHLVTFASGRRN